MTCKGVYASLGFSIYITKDELITLLRQGTKSGSAYIGKTLISDSGIEIMLSEDVQTQLLHAYATDLKAIREAKASMASGFLGRKRTKRKW